MANDNGAEQIFKEIESLKNQIEEFRALKQRWEKSEQVLKQSEEDYKKRTQSIYDVIYEIDSGGVFTFLSNSIEKYGYNPQELIGKHFSYFIHPDDVKKVSRDAVLPHYRGMVTGDENSPKLFDERRSGERMTKYLEIRIMPKDANAQEDYRIVELHSAGRWKTDNSENKFVGSIGIIRDVTERKKAEQELKSTYDRVQSLYDSLEQENKRLDELSRLKSGFVANASHEIRTPIAIIKESVELFLDHMSKNLVQEQRNVLAMTRNNIDRLARMVDSLLDASKIEAGKLQLDKTEFDIVKVTEDAALNIKPLADKNGVEIKTKKPELKLPVFCDREKIERVLINLLSNAVKFTPQGGIIEIECLSRQDEIEVSVQDTGCGIAEEDFPKLFDQFTQFGKKKEVKGTGLGLSITKGIIQMHGGRIWVQSKVGQGSKFYFTLPVLAKKDILRDILAKEISVAKTRKSYFSVLVVEIGSNDKGDFYIQKLKDAVDETLRRKNDIAYQIGSKVAVILPDTDKQNAVTVLARIKERLKSLTAGVHLDIKDTVVIYPSEAKDENDILSKICIDKQ
ncbi:MAG: ATP-binding protein [Candidatus Omnitrophica bacterium]|nr:ATP-binding protein [Candidatus Omnitrophota bacterium]